jgi:2-hydroxy-6-oxonona-2,4-dienedioate hydrolase
MPGWGESDTQTDETGRDHPAALVDFMDALGIEKAALVGNSMGGMTSVGTAIRFPEPHRDGRTVARPGHLLPGR